MPGQHPWNDLWNRAETPWDRGQAAPALVDFLAQRFAADHLPEAGGRALVPGAGRAYDALALAQYGFETIALDIAAGAVHAAQAIVGTAVDCRRGDFFAEGWRRHEETFDLIWDYTFLCALEPSQRPAWAARMAELITPGGTLAALLFPLQGPPSTAADARPPYSIEIAPLRRLLQADFDALFLAPPPASHAERVGREQLAIFRRRD